MTRFLAVLAGCSLLALVLVDAFNTLVLARRTRHVFRIARAFYTVTWGPFRWIAKRIEGSRQREGFLGIYGPASLLLLFALWAIALIVGFGLIRWAARDGGASGFLNSLYLSASTFFTLTNGSPPNAVSKLIAMAEGGLGLAFLGGVISYLPVLYDAFSRRELTISLFDSRAGSPPSAGGLLRWAPLSADTMEKELERWERWEAQLLANQLSFPMLGYFRSQHSNQSWLTTLVVIIDFSAVVSLAAQGDLRRQAELTFATGRHVLADLTVLAGLEKDCARFAQHERLSHNELERLRQRLSLGRRGMELDSSSWSRLKTFRRAYEPLALALSEHFLMAVPNWISDEATRGNWQMSVTDRDEAVFSVSDPFRENDENSPASDSR